MSTEDAVNNLYRKYSWYGVTKKFIRDAIVSGIKEYGLSLLTVYNSIRMILARETGEHGYFSVQDVAEITGETKEQVIERIEEYRKELLQNGQDPDEYFQRAEPKQTFLFMNTLK